MANIGTIAAFAGKCDTIFSDELNHASIIDGCRLSRAKVVVYRHNDMIDLEAKIAANPVEGVGLIVSDAVFSMDGDIVNLPEFVAIAERHGFFSMVDEAHSTGVLGATGRGVVEHFGGAYRPDIVMGTLSKSFGSLGGFVCGRSVLSDFLRNTARSYIFSTSLTPADIAAATAAIRYLAAHPELPGRLRRNSEVFCWALCRRGIKVNPGTAIVPVIIGDENLALDASKKLLDRGYIIPAIRYPTVPRGSARLRVALMATHTEAELVAAANAIADVFK